MVRSENLATGEISDGSGILRKASTYRVAWLLSKNLREFDRIGIVVERFGQVNHVVSRLLLLTGPWSCKKRSKAGYCDSITLCSATSCVLK